MKHDGRIDLVVSDVVMPEMDGPTLLGETAPAQPGDQGRLRSPATPKRPFARTWAERREGLVSNWVPAVTGGLAPPILWMRYRRHFAGGDRSSRRRNLLAPRLAGRRWRLCGSGFGSRPRGQYKRMAEVRIQMPFRRTVMHINGWAPASRTPQTGDARALWVSVRCTSQAH